MLGVIGAWIPNDFMESTYHAWTVCLRIRFKGDNKTLHVQATVFQAFEHGFLGDNPLTDIILKVI